IDPDIARRPYDAPDYPEIANAALKEMHRQVGDLVVNPQGTAVHGLLVRHLVLPENLAGTREAMAFIAKEISPNTYVNVMSQYRPMGHAAKVPELARPVGAREYRDALNEAREEGIHRLDRP
ncbi:MAG: radical SAM protein, partial [Desulfobacterales bacterium]|nr:radical SAM protein [Desulfobacterales bacterium]